MSHQWMRILLLLYYCYLLPTTIQQLILWCQSHVGHVLKSFVVHTIQFVFEANVQEVLTLHTFRCCWPLSMLDFITMMVYMGYGHGGLLLINVMIQTFEQYIQNMCDRYICRLDIARQAPRNKFSIVDVCMWNVGTSDHQTVHSFWCSSSIALDSRCLLSCH